MKIFKYITISFLLFSQVAYSAIKEDELLSYKSWKERQIVKAQNRVVQIANQLLMAESQEYQMVEVPASWPEVFKNSTNQKDKTMSLSEAKQALKQSKENLQATKELGFEDYVEIYLQLTKDDSESLKNWLSKLTDDEVAKLVTHIYGQRHSSGLEFRKPNFRSDSDSETNFNQGNNKISSNIKELEEPSKK